MTRLALLLAPLALAACDGAGTSISLSGNGSDGNVSIKTGADGQLAIHAPGVSIASKLPKISLTAENFDVDGLKLYPDSAIRELNAVGDNEAAEKDQGEVTVAFASNMPIVRRTACGNFCTQAPTASKSVAAATRAL